MKKILLIGGNGLIGGSIYFHLEKQNKVKVLDLYGNKKNIIKSDISNFKNLKKTLDKYLKKNKIEVVINASYPKVKAQIKDPLKINPEIIVKNYKSHFVGYLNVIQYFSNYYKKNKIRGKIINFASIYAEILPRFNIYKKNKILTPMEYGMIKSNIVYITKYFAKYLLGSGITINCISPGGVFDNQNRLFVKNYSNYTNSREMMKKNDFNFFLDYLIDDKSNKITGQNFIIDDGFSL